MKTPSPSAHPRPLRSPGRVLRVLGAVLLVSLAFTATAQVAGFTSIVSSDQDFDAAPGLSRLTPQQAAASL